MVSARLYVGDRHLRLAQYALLGMGGVRALRALGIDPGLLHVNEGHAALAGVELAREAVAAGASFDEALEESRRRMVFTTHTPIAAGNESYTADEVDAVLGGLPGALGVDDHRFLGLGRSRPEDAHEPFGMTQLGIRLSRAANAVSRLHGDVARGMWQPMFPDRLRQDVPIGQVTNGVHLPTWMAPPMRRLLDRFLGAGWWDRAADPATWEAVEDIPDEDLWAVRNDLRADLVGYLRGRSAAERLGRGEPAAYVEAAAQAFDPEVLTIGFARRLVGYKRLSLLVHDLDRVFRILETPVQIVLAGKAHPSDDEAKRILEHVFGLKWAPHVAERVAYLEDYEMGVAWHLVSGCDLWVNLPRPPLEASGTSGMKSALNGGLQLGVLDGWWAEAHDGHNGWAITGEPTPDTGAQDARDAATLYDLVEQEVISLFRDRDGSGVPREWVRRIKASLRSLAPRFNATRMMGDYLDGSYRSS